MNMDIMALRAYVNSHRHGFWDDDDGSLAYDAMKIALIHSEASEALEQLREGHSPDDLYYKRADGTYTESSAERDGTLNKPEGVPSELADILIRVGDYAHARGIDLQEAVREKMAYNETRPVKHGKRF